MSCQAPGVDSGTILTPAEGVVSVAIGDEVVVFRVAPPDSFVLNATAGLLWQCLDGASRLGDILTDLADAFRVDRGEVEKDCLPIVTTWLAHRLVEEALGG